jgi:hypothetical protein
MRIGSSRALWRAVVLAGLAMVAAPVAVWAQTPGEGSLEGFNLAADASGVSVLFGDPGSQPYPVAAAQVPLTTATYATGPSAYALSSLGWPGPLLANLGSLSGLLLPLCVPDGNGVCLPKPDTQTQNLFNYPVRAEASYPGGKPRDSLGPMVSSADELAGDAQASVSDFSSPGLVSVGRVTTHARTERSGDRVVATAESVLSDVALAGGVIKIAALRTVVQATSDGSAVTTSRDVTVEGMEVAGQPVTITDKGLRAGTTTGDNPASGLVAAANEQLLRQMGITLTLTRSVEDRPGPGAANVTSGSLTMVWDLGGSGYFATVTLGGASVRAQASTGGTEPVAEEPTAALPTGEPAPLPEVTATGGPELPAGLAPSPPGPVPSGPRARQRAAAPLGEAPTFRAAAYAGAPGPGWVGMGLAGVLAAGAGLTRLRRLSLAGTPGAGSCPLEGRTP